MSGSVRHTSCQASHTRVARRAGVSPGSGSSARPAVDHRVGQVGGPRAQRQVRADPDQVGPAAEVVLDRRRADPARVGDGTHRESRYPPDDQDVLDRAGQDAGAVVGVEEPWHGSEGVIDDAAMGVPDRCLWMTEDRGGRRPGATAGSVAGTCQRVRPCWHRCATKGPLAGTYQQRAGYLAASRGGPHGAGADPLWQAGREQCSRALGAVELRTGGESPRPDRCQRSVDQVELLDRRSKSG